MQTAEHDVSAATPVMIGDLIRAEGRRDVDLDDNQLLFVIQDQLLNVFVGDADLIVSVQVRGQRGKTKRRKQRILDGTKQRARRFSERGENHLYSHAVTLIQRTFLCKVLVVHFANHINR